MAHSAEIIKTIERTSTSTPALELYGSEDGVNRYALDGQGALPDVEAHIPQRYIDHGKAVIEGSFMALGAEPIVDRGVTATNLEKARSPNDVVRRLRANYEKGAKGSMMYLTEEGIAYCDDPEGDTTITVVRHNEETGEVTFVHPGDESTVGLFQPLEGDRVILSSAPVADYLTEDPAFVYQRIDQLATDEKVPIIMADISESATEAMLIQASERNYKQMKYREEAQAKKAREEAPEVPETPELKSSSEDEPAREEALTKVHALVSSYEAALRRIDAQEPEVPTWQNDLAAEIADSTESYGYEVGQTVTVRRSSGEKEADWTVKAVFDAADHEKGMRTIAYVEKTGPNGELLEKRVTLEDLNAWQSQEAEPSLENLRKHVEEQEYVESLAQNDDPAIEAAVRYLQSLDEQLESVGTGFGSKKKRAKLENLRDAQREKIRSLRHENATFVVDSEGVTERINVVSDMGDSTAEQKDTAAETESTESKSFLERMKARSNELLAKASATVLSGLFIAGNRLAHSEKRFDESDEMYEARIAVRGGRVVFGLGAAAGLLYWGLTRDGGGSEVVAITPDVPVEILPPAPESAPEFIVQPEARTITYAEGLNGWMERAGVTTPAERDALLTNASLIQELEAANFIYYDKLLPGTVKWGIAEAGPAPQAAIDILEKYAQK